MFNMPVNKLLSYLKKPLSNKEFLIECVSSINHPKNNSIIFVSEGRNLDVVRNVKECLLILPPYLNKNNKFDESNYLYESENPRLDYAIIVTKLLEISDHGKGYNNLNNNIVIGKSSVISENCNIKPNVFIDNNVIINRDCIIESGVRIHSNVTIGEGTVIGANSTIGYHGFGVEKFEDGRTIKIPQLGGVIIGKKCNISTNNNIHSGTIDPTILEDYVQTDSLVHIAHNCIIGESSIITACAEISGSVKIGKNCYIGPNASIINKISLGEGTIVGIGAVVTKSFSSNSIIAGNPARHTYEIREAKKKMHKLMEVIEDEDGIDG